MQRLLICRPVKEIVLIRRGKDPILVSGNSGTGRIRFLPEDRAGFLWDKIEAGRNIQFQLIEDEELGYILEITGEFDEEAATAWLESALTIAQGTGLRIAANCIGLAPGYIILTVAQYEALSDFWIDPIIDRVLNLPDEPGVGDRYILLPRPFLPPPTWGTADYESGSAIAADSVGNVLSAGQTNSTSYLLKYDSDGNPIWAKEWGGNKFAAAWAVTTDGLNNVYLAGDDNIGSSRLAAYLVKFDASGNILWEQNWRPVDGWARDKTLAVDGDGNIYGSGYTNGSEEDILLLKYDPDGNFVWAKQWGTTGLADSAYSLIYSGGILYLAGYTSSTGAGTQNGLIMGWDTDGNVLWQKTWGIADKNSAFYDLARDSEGNSYIAGEADGKALLVKYGPDGTLAWSRTWQSGEGAYSSAVGVDVSPDGNIRLALNNYADSFSGIVLVKFSPDGGVLAAKNVIANGGDSSAQVAAMLLLGENVFLAGTTYGAGSEWSDISGFCADIAGTETIPEISATTASGTPSEISGFALEPAGSDTFAGSSDGFVIGEPSWPGGNPNQIAEYKDSGWVFKTPSVGWATVVENGLKISIFNGTAWTEQSGGGGSGLELGETSRTAYRGDRGKTAYDHSQATGTPHVTTEEKAAWNGKQAAGSYEVTTAKGAASGYAGLDENGKVPSGQLPSYVDDVLEYANLAAMPATGETGKIYIALDTNLCYRWSGSVYVIVSQSLALGELEGTAYRGDRGKTAYDHSQATGTPHVTTEEKAAWNGKANQGLTWNNVTGTTQQAAVDNGYIAQNAALVTVTLPTSAAVGKLVAVAGAGAGGWKIAQNAGQSIQFADLVTAAGTGGYLASSNQFDAIKLICITTDTTWAVIDCEGNITVV